jgi:hypothetical protein
MWTPESAPIASAVRIVSTAFGGPIESAVMEVTSLGSFSRIRIACSTAGC